MTEWCSYTIGRCSFKINRHKQSSVTSSGRLYSFSHYWLLLISDLLVAGFGYKCLMTEGFCFIKGFVLTKTSKIWMESVVHVWLKYGLTRSCDVPLQDTLRGNITEATAENSRQVWVGEWSLTAMGDLPSIIITWFKSHLPSAKCGWSFCFVSGRKRGCVYLP